MSAATEFNAKAELAILESKLEWPNKETIRPYLEKLLANPGSMVFVALETPRAPEGPRVGKGWFSASERELLRKALEKINDRRRQAKEKLTTEPP
jgi:hypothetical protein